MVALALAGCARPTSVAVPPKAEMLHTRRAVVRPFDSEAWKLERIPSYRDSDIGVRASMAADALRRMKLGMRLSDLMRELDEPNRAELRTDADKLDEPFFGKDGYLLLAYPVEVEDEFHRHVDLEFLFDASGRLIASRRIAKEGSIRLGP